MPESHDHNVNEAEEAESRPPSTDKRDEPGGERQSTTTASDLSRLAGGVLVALGSQAVVIAAVLFYFGWARVRATYEYFGIDVSVLNFSASDYVLRSASTAFPLLVAIGFLALGAFIVNEQLRPAFAKDNALSARQLVPVLGWIGAVLVTVGFFLALTLRNSAGSEIWGPASMVIGFGVAFYALVVRDSFVAHGGPHLNIIVLSLMLLALLWTILAYADYLGNRTAEQVQAGLPAAPNVIVYSSADLSLSGPGVIMSRIQGPDSQYHFRYSGLRLLVSSGGQYFLLPSGWQPGRGSVIVLPVASGGGAASTRVEFQAPR